MSFTDRDKVELSGLYDEQGRLHELTVRLNADGLSEEDVAAAIRMMFNPATVTTQRRELGSTAIIRVEGPPAVRIRQ